VHTGRSQVTLPVRPPRPEDAQLRVFDPPYVPPVAITEISSTPGQRTIEYDLRSRTQTVHHRVATAEARLPDIDASVVSNLELKCVIDDDNPNGARMEYQTTFGWKRGRTQPRTVAHAVVTTHATELEIDATLHAFDGDEQVFERAWQQRIKRKLV
jgi:hypothetical protein